MSVKTLYNPATLSRDELVANFVVRTKVFDKIFKDIKSSTMKYPEKHYLIQGQRGMGKTTLLLRLKYEVENTPALNNWLTPVFFGEESYDLTSLSKLWEKLLEYLDDEWGTGGVHYEHTEAFVDFNDYEKRCFEYLIEILRVNERKIILFFDNFGQLFLDNLTDKEKRRLREVLMNCNDIRIVGASAIVLQDLHNYAEPFYEFFHVVHLEGLTKEETLQLIERLQENCEEKIDIKKNKAKIETLAILTGGVIRTLMMVYQVLLDDQDGSALKDLEAVLDQVTPLYKHRIEDLPVQQRRIVDVIAKRWDAVSAKEIAAKIREDGKSISTKLISAHLQQLEKNNVIEKKPTDTKNNLYQLKERFFNIWYLMRNGDRRDKRRVKWLTKFLELWYDDENSLERFVQRHIKLLQSGKYHPSSALLIIEALTNSEKISSTNLVNLIKETSAILDDEQKKLLPDISEKKKNEAWEAYERGDIDRAINLVLSIENRNSIHQTVLAFYYVKANKFDEAYMALQNIKALDNKSLLLAANLYLVIGHPNDAIRVLLQHVGNKKEEWNRTMAEANLMLGNLEQAKNYLDAAARLGDKQSYLILADILQKKKAYSELESLYAQGIESGIELHKELLEFHLFVSQNRDRFKKAKTLLNELLRNRENESDPDLLLYNMISRIYDMDDDTIVFKGKDLEDIKKRYEQQQKYKRGYFIACNLLMRMYINDKSKRNATKILHDFKSNLVSSYPNLALAFVEVWDGRYGEATNRLKEYCDTRGNSDYFESELNDVNNALLLLLSRQQYHSVLDIFNHHEKLKEALKPTYYVLMTYLKGEYPNEIIKMGKELEQPVKDMLSRIDDMKDEYK